LFSEISTAFLGSSERYLKGKYTYAQSPLTNSLGFSERALHDAEKLVGFFLYHKCSGKINSSFATNLNPKACSSLNIDVLRFGCLKCT
jgi:hypothetical protein